MLNTYQISFIIMICADVLELNIDTTIGNHHAGTIVSTMPHKHVIQNLYNVTSIE